MVLRFLWNAIFGVLTLQEKKTVMDEAVAAIVNQHSEKSVHIFWTGFTIRDILVTSFNVSVILNSSSAKPTLLADTNVVLCQTLLSAMNLIDTIDASQKNLPWIVGFEEYSTAVEMTALFERFFDNGVLNVIAVYSDTSNASIYSYFPFTPGHCYNFQPVLIDEYIDGSFSRKVDLFRGGKMNNMQQCSMKVFLFPMPPEFPYPGTGPPMIQRIAKLFELVQNRMNFTPEFSYALNVEKGIDEMMENRRIVAMALASVVPRVIHSSPLAYRCNAWCIPTKFNTNHGIDMLTSTFQLDMWLAFLISILLTIGVAQLLFHHSRTAGSAWMLVFSTVVEMPSSKSFKELKINFFVVVLSIAFIVINTMFKARLHSLMSTSVQPIKMTENAEVYHSNLNLFSTFKNGWLSDSIGDALVSESRFRRWNRVDEESTKEMEKALIDGTGSLLVKDDYCRILANKFGKTNHGYYKVYSLRSCLASPPATYFSFAPKSPFADRIREVTAPLREFGLSERLLTNPLDVEMPSTVPIPIGLEDVFVIILVWIIGLICSMAVFIVELILIKKE